ncbi:tigger transposable element-derived protein 6-like [Eriocheir sinensis]|uniref:tigger transposable element-derived protein 6-like n=1 Tax=Eriocheir sinensis TaxID=95602 RepID=UPI0021C8B95F|nr:tigger transposable element-derived protein 6-like [Eriocheir sinensis]
MSYSLLRKHVKRSESEESFKDDMRGKKTVLATEVEEKIADTIKRMEKMGLGPTLLEFREIVKDFLLANGLETVFKDGMPGYEWATAFMHRHNMTLKTGGMMQLARKSVTSDPFVIHGFYELLRQEMARLEIMERPECIWNLDETGFPLDPSKAKTIGTKGAKTVRITSGSNRENISVLATCCADGTSLDPLIIFKGKNMQSSWVGTDALPETQYAVSESGWMTRVIFEDFFKSFVEKTKDIRPILLILDGHLSHTSLATVELAKQENISIIKLPAHCTDLLQPLDVACFAPLKSYYDSALMRYVHQTGARAPLQKRGFVNMLCQVWKEGLSPENIKAGFYATGIHPLNPEKYKSDRLCPLKMKTYKAWIEREAPGMMKIILYCMMLQLITQTTEIHNHHRKIHRTLHNLLMPIPQMFPLLQYLNQE